MSTKIPKSAEQRRKHEINFSEIFNAIPLPCLLLKPGPDGTFCIVTANDAYLQTTFKTKELLSGPLTCQSFPGYANQHKKETCEWLKTSLAYVLKTKRSDKKERIAIDFLKEDGTFRRCFWNIENKPVLSKDKEVEYILHSVKDITAQVNSEEKEKKVLHELNEKKLQDEHFYEKNQDGLYSLDFHGKFTSGNASIARLAEVNLEELLQMNFLPFCAPHDKDRIVKHFQDALNGKSSKFEADFISVKNKEIILEISLMPMKVKEGIVGAYGIAKDITEKKKNEKVVVEKKKYLKVNAALISALLQNELQQESIQNAFGMIGETIGVDRMYYFGAHKEKETHETLISQEIEWCSKNAEPQIHNPEMINMPAAKLEEIMGPLTKNLPFIATLSELPEGGMKEIFIDQQIRAMLLLPIFLHDEFNGFIGFDDCTRERSWTEDEITFLKNLTHNFTSALEKKVAEETLKKQEEQLQLRELKFKALVQEGSDLISILDPEGNYIFVSATTKAILGIAPEELTGKRAFDFIHPEDVARIQSEFKSLEHKKQIRLSPFRFKNKEGNWRWLESTITNMLDDPAVQGMVSNARDVTTILHQAREIESINERYKLAATATNDLIYDWDLKKDEVHRFHRSLKELYGYSSEEINETNFWKKNIHPDDLNQDLRKLRIALSNPTENFIISEFRFRRKDGSYAKVVDKGYIIRNQEGKPVRIVGATSDISELTAKKEALKIANQRFKLAMKATKEMIWDWDIETDKVERSNIYTKLYGYTKNEDSVANCFWQSKIHPKDALRIKKSLQAALENKNQKKWKEEYKFIKANGNTAYIIDRGYIIRDENGKPKRMVGAVLDVTDSRQRVREIKQQNKILKEIAWEQSHLVRAPLARFKGLLHLLEFHENQEFTISEIRNHLRESANELDEIIRGIVTKTEKIEVKPPSPHD